MVGQLPTSLELGGVVFKIRSDYREILNILVAFNDPDLTMQERWQVALICFYEDVANITDETIDEAMGKITWFISGGRMPENHVQNKLPLYDWEQDESMIFSAINKVAGQEIRSLPYMHWWTFLGYFNEIGEGAFSTVVSIRNKQNKGKKLEKYEQEFIKDHADIFRLKSKLTEQEQKEAQQFKDDINNLFK